MTNFLLLYQNFLLVSLRTGCLLYFCPPWDSSYIPAPIRVLSILGLSLALTPIVSPCLPPFPANWTAGVLLVIREFLIGLGCGLVFRFFFAGIEMAGNLVATQMGFGMATLLDPQTQAQNTIMAEMMVLWPLSCSSPSMAIMPFCVWWSKVFRKCRSVPLFRSRTAFLAMSSTSAA